MLVRKILFALLGAAIIFLVGCSTENNMSSGPFSDISNEVSSMQDDEKSAEPSLAEGQEASQGPSAASDISEYVLPEPMKGWKWCELDIPVKGLEKAEERSVQAVMLVPSDWRFKENRSDQMISDEISFRFYCAAYISTPDNPGSYYLWSEDTENRAHITLENHEVYRQVGSTPPKGMSPDEVLHMYSYRFQSGDYLLQFMFYAIGGNNTEAMLAHETVINSFHFLDS